MSDRCPFDAREVRVAREVHVLDPVLRAARLASSTRSAEHDDPEADAPTLEERRELVLFDR